MSINIVLLEPEKPPNTATIGRTCVCCGAKLHIIKPITFDLGDKAVKRAGLDYWERLEFYVYENFQDFLEKNNYPKIYMATTKALQTYADAKYEKDDYIMFGKESRGIPEEILKEYKDTCVRVPMKSNERSINLSNTVSIILYEAYRQNGFFDLEKTGALHNSNWEE